MTISYKGPVVLVIMDGVGERDGAEGNAVAQAHTETLNKLKAGYPHATLLAAGEAVGIPEGDMGNSEVGHNAMGAGQIIQQGPTRVQEMIDSGEIFRSPTWQAAIANVKEHSATLHLIGLLSDANIHSHINHVFALMKDALSQGITRIRVHICLDGRDVPPESAENYIDMFNDYVVSLGSPDYKIASGGGRMIYWMDRYENDWGIVECGWRTSVLGEGRQFADAKDAVLTLRAEHKPPNDQYLPSFVIAEDGQPIGTINDGDSVIYFNFRADRSVQAATAFTFDDFPHFDRVRRPDIYFAGMAEYNADTHIPANVLVAQPKITNTLNELCVAHHISQYAVSETVKYGHITYYFDGNSYAPQDALHQYVEIPSDTDTSRINTRPWMKSAEITDALIDAIQSGQFRFMRANFANGDMVGHYGELESAILAVESVDLALGRIIKAVDEAGGVCIITADHGNAEEISDAEGGPKTSHTTAPVSCIFYDNTDNKDLYHITPPSDAGLSNLAATIALLLDLPPLDAWRPPIITPNT